MTLKTFKTGTPYTRSHNKAGSRVFGVQSAVPEKIHRTSGLKISALEDPNGEQLGGPTHETDLSPLQATVANSGGRGRGTHSRKR